MQKWGQHFLADKEALRKIIESAGLSRNDAVLEIGPGKGALTRLLETHVGKICAVEIDASLCQHLRQVCGEKVIIKNKNFLSVEEEEIESILGKNWNIIANLPFYITSPILQKLYSWKGWMEAVLTVQKEVGERMTSGPGSKAYGLLSILTVIYTYPELLFVIPREAFNPKPRVDAAVVRLRKREHPLVEEAHLEDFFSFLKKCFSTRRKMLVNTLMRSLSLTKIETGKMLSEAHIMPTQRPEEISLNTFMVLYQLTKRK